MNKLNRIYAGLFMQDDKCSLIELANWRTGEIAKLRGGLSDFRSFGLSDFRPFGFSDLRPIGLSTLQIIA